MGPKLRVFVPGATPQLARAQVEAQLEGLMVSEMQAVAPELEDAFIALLQQRQPAGQDDAQQTQVWLDGDPPKGDGIAIAARELSRDFDHFRAVDRVSFEVRQGEIFGLLGANGAGKTTTLKAISNLLRAERGDVTKGSITFRDQRIDQLNPSELVKRGICQVMEGRHCFQHLTVEENLLTGAYTRGMAGDIRADLEKVYQYFPRLKERRNSQSGYTSGGEQQMTAIGRALMARPKMILMDEPSMGLSPLLVKEVFSIIQKINRDLGVTILLVEQNARAALSVASHGYIMEQGKVVLDGTAAQLRDNEDVKEFYLGGAGDQRKSFKNLKSFKRRKRWL